jgi:carbonic anhydrase
MEIRKADLGLETVTISSANHSSANVPVIVSGLAPVPTVSIPGRGMTKEEAFQRILEGHWRYLQNQRESITTTSEDRSRHSQGQYPFAAILGCADSRVSPEVIFDQGQGDIFVVRVAGHVVGDFEVASLEYAIEHLGVSLVIVMGHEHCGAVKAALGVQAGASIEGPIGKLLEAIQPAASEARGLEGDLLGQAIRSHVRRSVDAMFEHSACMRLAVDGGTLRVIGLVYDLASGDLDIQKTVG